MILIRLFPHQSIYVTICYVTLQLCPLTTIPYLYLLLDDIAPMALVQDQGILDLTGISFITIFCELDLHNPECLYLNPKLSYSYPLPVLLIGKPVEYYSIKFLQCEGIGDQQVKFTNHILDRQTLSLSSRTQFEQTVS